MSYEAYGKSECCGSSCYMGTPEEPCWGDVTVYDEVPVGDDDYAWVHACEGHIEVAEGSGSYRYYPKPTVARSAALPEGKE